MRPSRRLGYRFDVVFRADVRGGGLRLAVSNLGALGVHLQARSLTVPGAPFSFTIGPGDDLATVLPDPGTYDLSLHGPNGFFRHFEGSPATEVAVESGSERHSRYLRLRLTAASRHGRERYRHRDRRGGPIRVHLADAYGPGRDIEFHEAAELVVDTANTGGWYDITLTMPTDNSFGVELAGRLESATHLMSDPQLGRS